MFACEIGKDGCNRTGCTAHRCPYGWCQRYYACAECWSKPEVKAMFTKAGGKHESCRINHEEYAKKEAQRAELLTAGKFLRVSALGLDENGTVQVIFRNGAGEEIGRYMPTDVYQALGYSTNTTLEDYEAEAIKQGASAVLPAPSEFYHTGNSSKEVAVQ